MVKGILVSLLLFYFFPSTYSHGGPEIRNKVKVVVIDAGHGGKDPGAVGKTYKEKDIVLAVALKTGEYIEQNFKDVKVIYTRTDDTFIPLDERPKIANRNKADLFISIHANASPRTISYGTETFVMGHDKDASNFEVAKLENSVITLEEDYTTKYEGFDPNNTESYIIFSLLQHTHRGQSISMASFVQDQFREKAKRVDRGVKEAPFLVLWQTTMPSVLIELGFISHPQEEKYLASKQGQDYLASAIFRAFKDYKNEIESSSNFETIAAVKNQEETSPVGNLYFKVQLFSTRNAIPLSDKMFKDFILPEVFISGQWNKYAIGSFTSYEEASAYCTSIRNKYKDAFVIAVQEGTVIPVNEAISVQNENFQ